MLELGRGYAIGTPSDRYKTSYHNTKSKASNLSPSSHGLQQRYDLKQSANPGA